MRQKDCIFCAIANHEAPAGIVYEDNICIAFTDIHPRTRGHIQLVPKLHYRWIYDMPDMDKLFSVAQTMIRAIIPVLGADHVLIGTFGHEIHHAHVWIVPQYRKKTVTSVLEHGPGIGSADKIAVAKVLRDAVSKEV